MSDTVISIENLSKSYQLGVIGTGTFFGDLNRWWAQRRGKPDPYAKIGEKDHGNRMGEIIQAVDNVSFSVKQGDALGIIGRNGAGKSTLLKILSRVTAPTSGVVKAKGRIASLLEVGTGFHPELTGRENIYLNGAILGMSRAEVNRKFDEIVDFSGVEKFIDTPVKRYSSGMYVRLAFAVAAHLEPEILVVDEVLAVGDAEFQKKCLGKMSDVAGEGRTVLFVSHNMAAINRLCTRALLFDNGTLIMDGAANAVTAQYLQGVNIEDGRKWSLDAAPGTEDLKLLSVKLSRNDEDTFSSVVEVKDNLKLTMEYFVNRTGLRFRCVALFYSLGVCAFASVEPGEVVHEKTGRYISRVTIPAHLLAETEYTVSVSMLSSIGVKQHFVKVRDALSFQVFDSMTVASARGDYAENLVSTMRPMLDWQTAFVDSLPGRYD